MTTTLKPLLDKLSKDAASLELTYSGVDYSIVKHNTGITVSIIGNSNLKGCASFAVNVPLLKLVNFIADTIVFTGYADCVKTAATIIMDDIIGYINYDDEDDLDFYNSIRNNVVEMTSVYNIRYVQTMAEHIDLVATKLNGPYKLKLGKHDFIFTTNLIELNVGVTLDGTHHAGLVFSRLAPFTEMCERLSNATRIRHPENNLTSITTSWTISEALLSLIKTGIAFSKDERYVLLCDLLRHESELNTFEGYGYTFEVKLWCELLVIVIKKPNEYCKTLRYNNAATINGVVTDVDNILRGLGVCTDEGCVGRGIDDIITKLNDDK